MGTSLIGSKLGRITGLDPGGPGFFTIDPVTLKPVALNPETCLVKTDAKFVDVIHTNIFSQGTPVASGDVDFFVDLCGADQCRCSDEFNPFTDLGDLGK